MSESIKTSADNEVPSTSGLPPSHIILATDFSARCDRAQDRAVELAQMWNASLTAVHALSDLSLTDDTSALDAYRRTALRNAALLRKELASADGLRSSVVVEEGPVEEVILAVAARESADLIVAGMARAGPLTQMLVGSSVNMLVRLSTVPVLVVKKKAWGAKAQAIVASDLSESSKPALTTALQWFDFRRLTLFHAIDPPYRGWLDDKADYDRQFEAAAIEHGRSFIRDVAGADASSWFNIIARRGDPAAELQALTNEIDADLVIAGTHGRTGLMQALLGSVAARILNEVASDVLVVPSRPR